MKESERKHEKNLFCYKSSITDIVKADSL